MSTIHDSSYITSTTVLWPQVQPSLHLYFMPRPFLQDVSIDKSRHVESPLHKSNEQCGKTMQRSNLDSKHPRIFILFQLLQYHGMINPQHVEPYLTFTPHQIFHMFQTNTSRHVIISLQKKKEKQILDVIIL